MFLLPIEILALLQGIAKFLLPQCACCDFSAHVMNPMCVYSQHLKGYPLSFVSRVLLLTPECKEPCSISFSFSSLIIHSTVKKYPLSIEFHKYFRTLTPLINQSLKGRDQSLLFFASVPVPSKQSDPLGGT